MNDLLQRQFDYRPKIAVFGDAMLDEYYDVNADRVSPEFPIPVLLSKDGQPHKLALGGAANVCAQFSNFNFDISLFAIVSEKIKSLSRNINIQGCVVQESVPVKKRFYSEGFPLCRLDVESPNYGLESISFLQDQIFSNLCSSGPFDIVVFSDYNKGLLGGQKEFISELGDAITIVDPKKSPIERWKGCSIIKPNAKEAREISGKEDPAEQCEYFMAKTGCQAVVITQGGSGIFGNVMGSWFEYRPTYKKNVRSVVGAGDCFVAFLSMCMAHSIDIRKAVEIAFDACSHYVEKPYNAPIFPYQIENSKFVDPRNLNIRDFTLSFTNGCFDVLHPGHIGLLQFAKSKSEKLVVALNSDESVRRQNKSHPLVNNIEYRKQMISALDCVDFVVEFSEDDPYQIIKTIKPDVLVKGSDWSNPVGSDIVREVCSFGLLGDYSTTSIIKKIKDI